MLRLNTLLIFTCLFLLPACKPKAKKLPENFDYGSIENNAYHNKYFGMDIKLPADWVVIDKEGRKKSRERSKAILGDGYKKIAEEMEKVEDVSNAVLLTLSKYRRDSSFDDVYNPSIAVIAENIRQIGNISAAGYLDRSKSLFKKAGLDVDCPDSYITTKVGGKEFKVMPVTMRIQGIPISQEYYVTIEKGFALGIILSFGNGYQKSELNGILSTTSFH